MFQIRPITLAVLCCLITFAARAADPVEVPLGGSVLVHIGGTARSVIIGNPAIADVTVESPRTIAVFGKYTGGTTLQILDGSGSILYQAAVVVMPGSADSVTLRYGGGKAWVPGGAAAIVDCLPGRCAPANTLPPETPYKARAAAAAPQK
ncbi:conserved exported hypothetical protein [Candidatus Terasakiella magnetica]|nr:conserved exported hypothetical protein [Candidatus Terasakiella magnetica]